MPLHLLVDNIKRKLKDALYQTNHAATILPATNAHDSWLTWLCCVWKLGTSRTTRF